ncbi:MAG: Histidine kinase [Magnetococcales bacterium]|nr:Histidine kinase [Magnetococcales bacterium]HIJ82598.1 GAF domain-containing sensor histidine kinase [Magnetococcales bacterium]
MTKTSEQPSIHGETSDTTMTVQQVNVIINRLLQLSLEPLSLEEYLDEVIFVLTAAPWLPIQNKGAIFLWDEKSNHLKLTAHINLSPDHVAQCQSVKLGQCLCGQAALSRQIINSHKMGDRHEIRPSDLQEHGDCCIPLRTEERILGVLNLYPLPDHRFNDQELTFLRAITSTLTSAIIRFDQEQQLKAAKAKAEADARQLARQHGELLEADRLRASVEHITRHDLKTPLAGIVSFADMLLERPDLDEEMRNFLRIILESGYRSLHMINLSLYLFQMEQKTYELKQEKIDLVPVIHTILRELTQQIKRSQANVAILLHGRPLEKGDQFLFLGEELLAYSMMANLIKNAVEASKPGQEIKVTMTITPPHACIEIHNPQPVDPQIRTRFFEKFVTSGKKLGTGLGTYSARLIAETLKGSITMSSTEAEGTTITIRLPSSQP